MYKNGIYFHLLVNGRYIDEYSHDGKIFVEGRKGTDYEIHLYNNTNIRRRIVFSVDGLNVMTGDNKWEHAYSLDPWKSITVPGWRIDNRKVAKFFFSSVKSSYNQHNDDGDRANVGVIGAMIFNEKWKQPEVVYTPPVVYHHHYSHPWWNPYGITISSGNVVISGMTGGVGEVKTSGHVDISDHPRSSGLSGQSVGGIGSVNCSYSSGAQASGKLGIASSELNNFERQHVGTGWGKEKEFHTRAVHYDFETQPCETLLIYYDSLKGLRNRGINVQVKTQHYVAPNAFPGYRDGCPYPK